MLEQLVATVRGYKGILKYSFRREERSAMSDNCFGLPVRAARRHGIWLPPDFDRLLEWGKAIEIGSVNDLQPFDWVLTASWWGGYSRDRLKDAGHLYIATGEETVIHLASKAGVTEVMAVSVLENSLIFRGVLRPNLSHRV